MENEELMVGEELAEEADSRLYEVSYLLVPTLAEETAEKEHEAVRAFIAKQGGAILFEGKPKNTVLAYPIVQSVNHKNTPYEQAYFGWFAFEKEGGVNDLKAHLEKVSPMIRFLIVKTQKEIYTMPPRRNLGARPTRAPMAEKEEVAAPLVTQDPTDEVVDDAQLEKEIEHLLA